MIINHKTKIGLSASRLEQTSLEKFENIDQVVINFGNDTRTYYGEISTNQNQIMSINDIIKDKPMTIGINNFVTASKVTLYKQMLNIIGSDGSISGTHELWYLKPDRGELEFIQDRLPSGTTTLRPIFTLKTVFD